MRVSSKSPLVESNIIKEPSLNHQPPQNLSNNSLEISMNPEQLSSLIQSSGLTNFNIKINIAGN
jgi:hypothetical protein